MLLLRVVMLMLLRLPGSAAQFRAVTGVHAVVLRRHAYYNPRAAELNIIKRKLAGFGIRSTRSRSVILPDRFGQPDRFVRVTRLRVKTAANVLRYQTEAPFPTEFTPEGVTLTK